ncbi:UDP-N-acetylmuramate--L-alanine ligase [Pelagibius litoralis]|uniref:UDP-N-acetylmuramate--L-alanine ligase n=1 Tax=Pelagibius litoralis TaxID=374515 RepID=A0A967C233_9PROT|nr:UDP-N-acetylmuramate--L-alanine ligase [Pelagibius litoralis]NIA68626.1 UDP-N-acetylmuramate--L-alanine ligase [Pelagibius litoralis]
MRGLPLNLGTIHFVGIGGIGMSGIAEVLANLGYQVQGSDMSDNANVQRLRKMGVEIFVGHRAENLGDAQVVVISSAIKAGNPEVDAARQRFIPIVRRAEMLGELMRLKWSIAVGGTHGKTTTTSMVATLLDGAGLDPTVINGGIINAYGTNARLGDGDWMVVEADESDGSFVKLPATIAVVTNIDPEHMDFYGSEEALHQAFEVFVENIPFYGFAVLCIDHPSVQALIGRIEDRRIITYGVSPQADYRAENIRVESGGLTYDIVVTERSGDTTSRIEAMHLPMLGQHNAMNALAAVAVAREMGLEETSIRQALSGFGGVKRRFTRTGEAGGVTVIDDYGHHPVEITAVLGAARQAAEGKVIAVVQPHRYTRLRDLFEQFCSCFNDADTVIVADVYAAGEQPIPGADRDGLVEGLRARGHRQPLALESAEALPAMIHELATPGDLVVCLGAGNITAWANALPEALQALQSGTAPSAGGGR